MNRIQGSLRYRVRRGSRSSCRASGMRGPPQHDVTPRFRSRVSSPRRLFFTRLRIHFPRARVGGGDLVVLLHRADATARRADLSSVHYLVFARRALDECGITFVVARVDKSPAEDSAIRTRDERYLPERRSGVAVRKKVRHVLSDISRSLVIALDPMQELQVNRSLNPAVARCERSMHAA